MAEATDEQVAQAFRSLLNHPEVGIEAKRLYKKANPKANFPELDAEERISSVTKPLLEEIEKLRASQTERDIHQRRAENHALCRQAGLDPNEVEKVMTDNKIASYETAIKFLEGQRALAPATPAQLTPIAMPDDFKDIAKNPAKWARDTAFAAINELKSRRTG